MTHLPPIGRRTLLKSAGGALIVGFFHGTGREAWSAEAPFAPNAFVRIAPDNTVTVLSKHIEMGQGSYNGLARIVAEDLDADWAQMRATGAPADTKLYANLAFGMQGTGGSSSIANSYEQLRKAGATARAMLVQAAAKTWNVPAEQITVSKGVVAHAAGKHSATFGELAAAAAKLPVPENVTLKDPKTFTLIGKPDHRIDVPEKSDGTALYGLDVRFPGMVTATIARPPRFGSVMKSFDDTGARAVPGVKQVVAVPTGVAVIADSYWAAARGRDALKIEWDDSKADLRSTPQITAEYKKLAGEPGKKAKTEGDVDAAFKNAKVITADYEVPFLAHAPMEPLNCVVRRSDSGAELWYGCQFQTVDQANVAKLLGVKPEQVTINTLFAGGSFGRRANFGSDFVSETVEIAKQLPVGTPVRLVWSREDDIRGGRYRPAYYHRLQAALSPQGKLIAWKHRVVGQSIMAGTPFEAMMVKDGIDANSVEGAAELPYHIDNFAVELTTTKVGATVLWWRSVGSSHNAFVTEAFIDVMAKEAGKDPLEFRRAMMPADSTERKALDLAAEKAGWGSPLPAGRARGIAVAKSFGTSVAQVAEVSRDSSGRVKVHRVVCAVYCGTAVDPRGIEAQMEGGIAFGLGAAMKGEITLKDGKVEQGNFDTYDVLRMDEMPVVEVHIVPSDEKPTGTGEPGVPPIAPAVANAILALTGKPVTRLPMHRAAVGV